MVREPRQAGAAVSEPNAQVLIGNLQGLLRTTGGAMAIDLIHEDAERQAREGFELIAAEQRRLADALWAIRKRAQP